MRMMFLASETEKIQNVPTGAKSNKFQIRVCEFGIACNFGMRATGTSVSPDAHLWPTEGHTPTPGNTRVSACTYLHTPCIEIVSRGGVSAGRDREITD